ncbi:MAG: serine/threonine-protein kinase [Myxococcota bacterium]
MDVGLPSDGALLADRYRILSVLGQGADATVYHAEDTRLGVTRALKVHLGASEPALAARAEEEARVLSRFDHPAIVRVFDAFVDDGRLVLVLEHAPGGTLAERVRALGPLPPDEAVRVVSRVLEALEVCHAAGVVHRDVKPANVLLGEGGVVRLADFGLARVPDARRTETGAALGTWAYMAPEQRRDAARVDARADLYAAGATLYAALTGREPFDVGNPELSEPLLASLPAPLAEVVRKATRARPEDRYASAHQMREALLGPPASSARRRWPLFAAAAASLAVALAMLQPADEDAPPPVAAPIAAPAPPVPEPAAELAAAPPPASPAPRRASRPAAAEVAVAAPTPAAPVPITLNSVPWSEVWVDGRPLGRTAWKGELAPGAHEVAFVRDGARHETTLEVTEPATVCWDLATDSRCPS